MLRDHIQYGNVSLCRCRRKHKGSGFDLIRNDRILTLMECFHSADLDHIGSGSADIRSHTVQKVRHIHDMRLFRHIFHDRHTVCHCRSHHHVDRRADTDHVKIQMCAAKLFRLRNDLSMLDIHIGTQCAESFQMLVDRTASDIASARKRHLRTFIFSKESTQQIVRCPDLLDIIILNIEIPDRASVDLHCMPIDTLNHRTDSRDRLQHHIDVVDIRKILNLNGLVCHDRCCQNRKRRILCTANFYFPYQRISALNNILLHIAPQLSDIVIFIADFTLLLYLRRYAASILPSYTDAAPTIYKNVKTKFVL